MKYFWEMNYNLVRVVSNLFPLENMNTMDKEPKDVYFTNNIETKQSRPESTWSLVKLYAEKTLEGKGGTISNWI